MPPSDEKVIQSLLVIIARKADYLRSLFDRLGNKLSRLLPNDEERLRRKLTEIIAGMEPRLWVTRKEAQNRCLDPGIRLEDLNRQAIWNEIQSALFNQ